MAASSQLRWQLADDPSGTGALFDEVYEREPGRGEFRGLEFLHVRAKRIINEVPKASRMPFRYTINAYRGCSHACSYCFARPTHEYLNLDAGRDFETKIVVKVNAVERLRAELDPRRWRGDHIAMGTNTDPYQRCEGKYHLTEGIIGVLSAARNPFSILTKSTLILRDLELLREASKRTEVGVNLSIGTLDEEVWRMSEPGTPHPLRRVAAVARLNDAGIRCGVLVAPILPGMSDRPEQIDEVVRACAEAGATSISGIPLHLRPGVREQFMPWLEATRPDLVDDYQRLYPRSYTSKQEKERISGMIRDAADRHRRRPVSPVAARRVPAPEPKSKPKPKPAPEAPPEQLWLAL
jgi:DNA repair photolyase